MLDNILPVRRVIVSAQVGLKLSTQNLEGSTLSDTVGTDKSKHLTGSGHRKTVQLEAVGAISVGDLALKVGGQVIDRIEGAALRADTTTDTELLGDEGQLGIGLDLDTELSATDDGARLLALLTTFSRTTLKGGVRKCLADGGAQLDADGDDHTPCRC